MFVFTPLSSHVSTAIWLMFDLTYDNANLTWGRTAKSYNVVRYQANCMCIVFKAQRIQCVITYTIMMGDVRDFTLQEHTSVTRMLICAAESLKL